MRHRFAALLLCCLATLGQAATVEPSIGVTFPDEIAGVPLTGRKVFPQKELGVGLSYQRDSKLLRGGIYIYTSGARTIRADLDAPMVRNHFEEVMGDLKAWEGKATVRVKQGPGAGPVVTTFPGCGPQFLLREFEIDLPEGTLASATYLTVMNNNFVKLRVSYMKSEKQSAQDARSFVAQTRKLLGACR